MKKKNKGLLVGILVVLIVALVTYLIIARNNNRKKELEEKNRNDLIAQITSHYNNFVKTDKETILYNEAKEEVGKVGSGVELTLSDTDITYETEYFKIADFDGKYFVKYNDVSKIDTLTEKSDRYKKYIVFNQNIETGDTTAFYDENNNLVYQFNESFNLPIIVKDTDKYGVEFNNQLLYVKSENVKNVVDNYNTDLSNASGVGVLNYHFFYDANNAEEAEGCHEIICHTTSQFQSHLDYFRDNNILTLRMKELEDYVDGKIQLPKSVLITIDDGARTKHAVDLLTSYGMYGTIFLVTSWYDPTSYYVTDNVELHSHSHNLHNTGACPTGQGGGIQCLDKETLLSDLKTSRDLLNNTTAFCYPFYEYNDYSISVLKEAGFTMGFAGETGNALVRVGMDKFRLPRFVVVSYTTVNDLSNYFARIN